MNNSSSRSSAVHHLAALVCVALVVNVPSGIGASLPAAQPIKGEICGHAVSSAYWKCTWQPSPSSRVPLQCCCTMIRTPAELARSWRQPPSLRGAMQPGSNVRCLPNFLVVGAQKAGTTALYGHLLMHPQVAAAATKEAHFFDQHRPMTLNQYLGKMSKEQDDANRRRQTITGEATPAYMLGVHTAQGIARLLPHARLLVMLRNPTKRFYSEYQMKLRRVQDRTIANDTTAMARFRELAEQCERSPARRLHGTNKTTTAAALSDGGMWWFEEDEWNEAAVTAESDRDAALRDRKLASNSQSSAVAACLRAALLRERRFSLVLPRGDRQTAASTTANCLLRTKENGIESMKTCFEKSWLRIEAVLPLEEAMETEMEHVRRCVAPCDPVRADRGWDQRARPADFQSSAGFESWLSNLTAIAQWQTQVVRRQVTAARERTSPPEAFSPADRIRATASVASGAPSMDFLDGGPESAVLRRARDAMGAMERKEHVCHVDPEWANVVHKEKAAEAMQFQWGQLPNCWPRGSTSNIAFDFLVRGIYVEQVASLLEWFPREQLLFLSDTELREQPVETMRRVTSFLGLEEFSPSEVTAEKAAAAFAGKFPRFESTGWRNNAEYTPMPAPIEKRLRAFYAPFNRALYNILGRDFGWETT